MRPIVKTWFENKLERDCVRRPGSKMLKSENIHRTVNVYSVQSTRDPLINSQKYTKLQD